jgi:septum formation protein
MPDASPANPSPVSSEIILASNSPRRRELLGQIGISFRVLVADIDESVTAGEQPSDYVCRMALEKALAALRLDSSGQAVLAADTAVIVEGRILGKPLDRAEAKTMLHSLSGREHEVYSAVALALSEDDVRMRLNVTSVTFSELEDEWIEAYCNSEEPMDKAGAYAIQGLAAQRISQLAGSYSGVMGLPLFETAELLRSAGIAA